MNRLIELGRKLWETPEPGFFENETQNILSEAFRKLGFKVENFDGMPGFSAALGSDPHRKEILLISDMDALPVPGDPEGRYIHSCGHHVQMTALYGTAMLMLEQAPELLEHTAFAAIPAEEFIDSEKRMELVRKGNISKLSGKQELLERGFFKGYSYIISTHSASFTDKKYISSVLGMAGFNTMKFTFSGKASHAGAAPHKGINAQNAASLFLQACAFLREQFEESRHIRIHPVIKMETNQSVNLIPEKVYAETYVRAADQDTILEITGRLRNAAEGCAGALGASVEISENPGYESFKASRRLHELIRLTAEKENIQFIEEEYSSASSDVGDISNRIPTVMLGLPGVNGLFHNPGFRVTDEDAAYVFPSRFILNYIRTITESPDFKASL